MQRYRGILSKTKIILEHNFGPFIGSKMNVLVDWSKKSTCLKYVIITPFWNFSQKQTKTSSLFKYMIHKFKHAASSTCIYMSCIGIYTHAYICLVCLLLILSRLIIVVGSPSLVDHNCSLMHIKNIFWHPIHVFLFMGIRVYLLLILSCLITCILAHWHQVYLLKVSSYMLRIKPNFTLAMNTLGQASFVNTRKVSCPKLVGM